MKCTSLCFFEILSVMQFAYTKKEHFESQL